MNMYSKGIFLQGRPHTDSRAKGILRLAPVLTPSLEAADIRSKEMLFSNSCSNREEGISGFLPSDKSSPKGLLSEDER